MLFGTLQYAFRSMVCRFETQYFYISSHSYEGGLKKLGFMLLLLAFSTLFFNTAPSVYASSFELAHDDGNADYGWSDFYPYAAMVRFSPPSASWRITGVRLHATCVLRGSQVFYVQIWDAGLNTVYWSAFLPSSVFKNATLDWYTIRLPNVVVTGVFYVVIVPMFTLDGSQLWISVDDDQSIANTSFIVNVDDHTIHASLNASSRRPGDFMVRVEGEPAPTLPELKLSSIEFREGETIVVFTYPGELTGFGARLVKPDGSFTEENATRVGNSLIVNTRGEGLLNVFAVTPGYETVAASVRLTGGLRKTFESLLADYTVLKRDAENMSSKINSLLEENRGLRLRLNQSQTLVRLQEDRVTGLLADVSSLGGELDHARAEASVLRGLTILLAAGLVLTVSLLGFLEVGRRWRRGRQPDSY